MMKTLEMKISEADKHLKLGEVALDEDNTDEALAQFQRSCDIWRRLSAAAPGDALYLMEMGLGDLMIGRILHDQGRYDEALGCFYASLGATYRMQEVDDDEDFALSRMAYCHEGIAGTLEEQGDLQGALASYRSAVKLWRRVSEDLDSDYFDDNALIDCLGGAALILEQEQQMTEAIELLEEACTRMKVHVDKESPDVANGRMLASMLEGLSRMNFDAERRKVALDCYKACVALYRRLLDSHPDDDDLMERLGITLVNVGDVLHDRGDFSTALTYQREALEVDLKVVSRDPASARKCFNLGFAYKSLGDTLVALQDPNAALESCLQAVIHVRAAVSDPSSEPWWRECLEECETRVKELGGPVMARKDSSIVH